MELKSMAGPGADIFLRLPQVRDIVRDANRKVRVQVLRDLLKGEFRTLPAWADGSSKRPPPLRCSGG